MNYGVSELLKKLNKQMKETDLIYYNAAVSLGISETTFWILYTVSDRSRNYSQNELCDELLLPKTTVNSAIKNICHKGFAFLERAPNSHKKKTIRLTEQGVDFVRKYIHPLREAEITALSKLHSDERRYLIEISEKYTDNLREQTTRYLNDPKT